MRIAVIAGLDRTTQYFRAFMTNGEALEYRHTPHIAEYDGQRAERHAAHLSQVSRF
jgi:hypothetical protein